MEIPEELSKVKFVVEYDGTSYSGWAKSPSNPTPSIQEKVEAAWRKLFPQTTFLSIKASSRTDSGVHALGQVITIESDILFGTQSVLNPEKRQSACAARRERKRDPTARTDRRSHINSEPGLASELYRRLNSFLPDDIVLRSSTAVSLDFSAKDNSLRRMYRYEILNHPTRSALSRNFCWHIKHPLDISQMRIAANLFVGTHNMSFYCPKPYLPDETVKHIKKIEESRLIVSEDQTRITYEVVGSSFMYKQVRNMVGMLAEVGLGKWTTDQLQATLSDPTSRLAFQGAPAHGLTLIWVEHYGDEELLVSPPTSSIEPQPPL